MSNIPPTQPFPVTSNSAKPSHGVIPSPPSSLARLTAGTIVEGIVVGRTTQGLVAVQTSHGEIGVRTTSAPPVNTPVVLQLQPTGGQVRVILISAEGRQGGRNQAQPAGRHTPQQQPQHQPQQQPQAGAPSQVGSGGPPSQAAPPLAGQPIAPPRAPIVSTVPTVPTAPAAPNVPAAQNAPATPVPPATPTPGAYQGAPHSTPPTGGYQGQPATTAPAGTGPAPANPVGAAGPQATAQAGALPGAQSNAPLGVAPAGSLGSVTPVAGQSALPSAAAQPASPPGQAVPSANAPGPISPGQAIQTAPAPGGLQGTPSASATTGQTLVPSAQPTAPGQTTNTHAAAPSTPLAPRGPATPTVQTPTNLPTNPQAPAPPVNVGGATGLAGGTSPGAPLALTPTPATTSLDAAAVTGRTPAAAQPAPWPALVTAVETLQQSAVPAITAAVDAVIPRPGPQLGGALVLLMSALRGGDLRGWLGQDSLNELSRLKGAPTTQALADDFNELARPTRNDTGDWRVFNLPLFDGAQQQQIRLYLKRRGRQGDGETETPSRFVFEMDLSRLGALQLDGLASRGRFDLVVRSTAPLPDTVQGDIGVLFGQVRQANDFAGEVYFQTVPAFTAAPASKPPSRADGLVV